MAERTKNMFTSYALTDQEQLVGCVLSSLQEQVIQTRLAEVAEAKLTLEYDVANPTTFIQQEAYKAGELAALNYILEMSEASKELLSQETTHL